MRDAVFTPIDMRTWHMAQEYHYYTCIAPTGYSLTVNLDVTDTYNALKAKNMRFFPAYLYLLSRVICDIPELRVAVRDGVTGQWDYLTPTYPCFHEDDKSVSLLWTEYDPDFMTFYNRCLADFKAYGDDHGILSGKGIPPSNAFIASCIPWFTFTSFSLHNHGLKDYFVPSFESCKFICEKGKVIMPLSCTVHHATTDGYHLKLLFDELQSLFNSPDQWS